MTTATSHHHSNPFLLVRASDRDVTDVPDDEEDEGSSKSVPPRPPPMSVRPTDEQSLPSVIVDAGDLEAAAPASSAEADAQEALEVDGLLEAIEVHATSRDARRVQTLHAIDRPRAGRGALRRAGVFVVTATLLVGAAFAGMRVTHVSPRAVGAAALHILR